ncbi:MAG: PHP domain-containing protein [Bacteroidota bacterium]
MKIDFHTHTHHSYDSRMKPAKILRLAKARGLDGIVICDHNTIKGGIEARQLNTDANFEVIVGAEILTNAGDVTGIFLEKEIEAREFHAVVAEIRSQGGKVILNHPYYAHDLSLVDFSKIDYIEGYNGRCNEKLNQKAVALAQKHNLPIIAGSDAHLYQEVANCVTEVDNLENLQPINCTYKPTKQLYIMLSQYIKAWERKNLSIFISATKVFLKKTLKSILKLS